MKHNVIDLFAGCGGLIEGFLQTGDFETLAAVDWELPTVKTLSNRMIAKWSYDPQEHRVLHFDLQRTDDLLNGYDDKVYGKSVGLNKLVGSKNVDVVVGGPPCQAYSMAGRVQDKDGMQNDYRNFLFESYVKIVDTYKPKAFIFENVQGILSAKPGGVAITDRIREAFANIGYDIIDNLKEALFDLSYFNIPQSRKRVIIFGVPRSSKSGEQIDTFYKLLKDKQAEKQRPASDGFKNLPKIFPHEMKRNAKSSHFVEQISKNIIANHDPRFHNDRDIDIFKTLALDIQTGANRYASTDALKALYQERTGKVSKFHKYHVIRPDKPSNTIPAHLYKDGLRHIHPDPEQARTITVREAARLQSFPDDFEFLGGRGDQYKMVGNAVPPEFAKLIATIIQEVL